MLNQVQPKESSFYRPEAVGGFASLYFGEGLRVRCKRVNKLL